MAFHSYEHTVTCSRCGKEAHGVAMQYTTRRSKDFINLCGKCVAKISAAIKAKADRLAEAKQ